MPVANVAHTCTTHHICACLQQQLKDAELRAYEAQVTAARYFACLHNIRAAVQALYSDTGPGGASRLPEALFPYAGPISIIQRTAYEAVGEAIGLMQADRELDALVATKVLGWTGVSSCAALGKWGGCPPGDPEVHLLPPFSTQIAAAWEVFIAGLAKTGLAAIEADMEDYGRGTFIAEAAAEPQKGQASGDVWVTIGTKRYFGPVCEAICHAALAAVDPDYLPLLGRDRRARGACAEHG